MKTAKAAKTATTKLDKIRALMRSSYMEADQPVGVNDDITIGYSTRENGWYDDDGNERPGKADILHAREMRKRIEAEIPGVTCRVDYCDEWTNLTITVVFP